MSQLPRLIVAVLAIFVAGSGVLSAAPAESHEPKVIVDLSKMKPLVYSPIPEYPKEARQKHWGGFGIFEVQFRREGLVSAVFATLATGHKVLEGAVTSALRQWRSWKGYKMIVLMVPVTFAPDGAKTATAKQK